MKIAFDRNRYGVAARASLVADYVEACAWKYDRYQFDNMEGMLRRIGRARIGDAHVAGTTASEDEEESIESVDEPDDSSAADVMEEVSDGPQRAVIAVLQERRDELGSRYPFTVNDVDITWNRSEMVAYDSLLAMTLSHAFEVVPTISAGTIDNLFEQVSARCLESEMWSVHDLGTLGRRAPNFETLLSSLTSTLTWKLHAGATSRSVDAQEEGCDTLIMLPWGDSRPGRLFLIGQATVARSEEWRRKIHEPSPSAWGPRLQRPQYPLPIRFLTVPHHVERNTLVLLQEHAEGIVVDRLRLACGDRSDELSDDERAVVEYVRSAEIEA